MDSIDERIHYLTTRLTVPGAAMQTFTPDEWATLTDLPVLDQASGWTSLEVTGDPERPDLTMLLCPVLIAETSSAMPWSKVPDSWLEIVDDGDDDPGPDIQVIGVDRETFARQPCPVCQVVHACQEVELIFDDGDSPSPGPFWCFDNYVRFINEFLTTEAIGLHEGLDADDRRAVAFDRLYAKHPAVHRTVMRVLFGALEAAVS